MRQRVQFPRRQRVINLSLAYLAGRDPAARKASAAGGGAFYVDPARHVTVTIAGGSPADRAALARRMLTAIDHEFHLLGSNHDAHAFTRAAGEASL